MASERRVDLAIAMDSAVVARDISVLADTATAAAVEVDAEAVEALAAEAVREELAGAAATVVIRLLLASIEVA